MAETAGLVVGGIALVSLFSTILEVHDYLEEARRFSEDIKIVFTKVNVMQERLNQWNRSVTGGELELKSTETLDPKCPEETQTMYECLLGIQLVMKSLARVCIRYKRKRRIEIDGKDTSRPSPRRILPAPFSGSFVPNPVYDAAHPLGSQGNRKSWKLKWSWVVIDRRKVQKLIIEADFLINNLEKITESLRQHKETGSGQLCSKIVVTCQNLKLKCMI